MNGRRSLLRILALAPVATLARAQGKPYRVAYVTTERKDAPSPTWTRFARA